MPTPPNLKELTAKWYAKLAKKGFKDQEDEFGRLHHYSSDVYKRDLTIEVEAKTHYYSELAYQVAHHTFENKRDKKIMEMAAEGHLSTEIQEAVGVSHVKVRYTIRNFEQLWGLKKWKPEQIYRGLAKKKRRKCGK